MKEGGNMNKNQLLQKLIEMKKILKETPRIKGRDPVITKIKKQILFCKCYRVENSLCERLYKEIKIAFDDFMEEAECVEKEKAKNQQVA